MKNPNQELIGSIASPLTGLSKEMLEIGIDEITDNEVVKKIPILSSIIAGYRTFIAIREYQFMKKIMQFLFEQKGLSERERKIWLLKMDEKEQVKIGEVTLELLDKVNSMHKAKILGIIFCRLIAGKISSRDYIRVGEWFSPFIRTIWSIF